MCDLTLSDSLIELRPFIDEAVIRKLNERAVGVTKLSVRVPSDAEVEQQGGGQVGRALRNAVNDNTPDLTISMKWSFERTRGSDAGRRGLLEAARWIARGDWASKAEVSMLVPQTDADGETLRSEVHELFRDRVAFKAKFEVADNEHPSESSVLTAIQDAIERFNKVAT